MDNGQKALDSIAARKRVRQVQKRFKGEAQELAQAVLDAKDKLGICESCNNISDSDLCNSCRGPQRDLCIVEERTIFFRSRRRASSKGCTTCHGSISLLRGLGPEALRIKNRLERLAAGEVQEIILATNPAVEGDATAVYLSRLLRLLGVRVARIAIGIPASSDLESCG